MDYRFNFDLALKAAGTQQAAVTGETSGRFSNRP
jgi:hypothetical protein